MASDKNQVEICKKKKVKINEYVDLETDFIEMCHLKTIAVPLIIGALDRKIETNILIRFQVTPTYKR